MVELRTQIVESRIQVTVTICVLIENKAVKGLELHGFIFVKTRFMMSQI